jgi:hypothetical protein
VPLANEPLIVRGGGGLLIDIEKLPVAVTPAESATSSVTFEFPAADGVPVIWPVPAFRFRPAGREPELTDQLYGGVPPLAERDAVYADPALPAGRDAVVIASGGVIATENDFDAVIPFASLT